MTLRLLLARHGRTAWNAERRFQGQADIPLDEIGLSQAAALAARLRTEIFDVIYASDLQRSWRTAATIVEATNAGKTANDISTQSPRLIAEPRLREMNFGAWQGLTFAEIHAQDAQRLEAWVSDRTRVAPPGGETLLQFSQRLQVLLDHLRASHPAGTVLLVGHGGPFQVLLCLALGLPASEFWKFNFSNASLSEITLLAEGAIVNCLNDVCHLAQIG